MILNSDPAYKYKLLTEGEHMGTYLIRERKLDWLKFVLKWEYMFLYIFVMFRVSMFPQFKFSELMSRFQFYPIYFVRFLFFASLQFNVYNRGKNWNTQDLVEWVEVFAEV